MTKKSYTEADIRKQTDAAKILIEALATEDEQLVHDMVEGETDFFEAIEKALDEMTDAMTILEGTTAVIKKITERKTRAKNKIDKLRGLIEQAFTIAEIKSHTFDVATVTIKPTPAQVVIEEEADIPAKYFAPQPPKLDKAALNADVKAGEDVAGARLTNGGQTVQIRWS